MNRVKHTSRVGRKSPKRKFSAVAGNSRASVDESKDSDSLVDGNASISLAGAFSDSLANIALRHSPLHATLEHSHAGEEQSVSREGLELIITRMSDVSSKGSSASSDEANSGESANFVTASAKTATTSSGDDRDSSGGTTSPGENHGRDGTASVESAQDNQKESDSSQTQRRHHSHHHHSHHHHHHHHHNARTKAKNDPTGASMDDGSTLPLPGNDGSDQLAGGPATVVASHLPPPNSDSQNSSSGSGTEGEKHDGLLQPRREPGFHTIKSTFSRLSVARSPNPEGKRSPTKPSSNLDTSSFSEGDKLKKLTRVKRKRTSFRLGGAKGRAPQSPSIEEGARASPPPPSIDSQEMNEESSSGSGTEGGYMGSADSKENESSSSPSVSSCEAWRQKRKSKRRRASTSNNRQMIQVKSRVDESGDSSSSEIADFSSGSTYEHGEGQAGGFTIDTYQSASPSISSSNDDGSSDDDEENVYIRRKRKLLGNRLESRNMAIGDLIKKPRATPRDGLLTRSKLRFKGLHVDEPSSPPILSLGSDIMAHVLTFLRPPEILEVLTMPLSKEWRQGFTLQPELWRVLCLVEPFKAVIADDETRELDNEKSNEPLMSQDPKLLDRYRMLYSSFVRCMRYLAQIREDAISGRQPLYIDYGSKGHSTQVEETVATPDRDCSKPDAIQQCDGSSEVPMATNENEASHQSEAMATNSEEKVRVLDQKHGSSCPSKKRKKARTAISMITDRLLGPSASGVPGNLDLPWSCAIYSIVNWMVAYSDVEGIQTLCMKVLPFLLENEQQRQTAQRAGLTDVVLRAMVSFPTSAQLHIAAFHTIVLLARPLGGREGMLFRSSMTLTGLFDDHNRKDPRSGIAIMVDSMKRFEDDAVLQAMSCWALVNVALAPSQKAVLVKLGGIEATTNAMERHPMSAEVQFRALFALINLVIPSVRLAAEPDGIANILSSSESFPRTAEKDIIDGMVGRITKLVVHAMKNFCSSEAILNRACLVLHNLSLTQEYHAVILWTPNCYQMLEWCLRNYRSDQVLQQSATGSLHRLQMSLSRDKDLRTRFREELRSQHQSSLAEAHREALLLHERQHELSRAQN